MQYVKIVLCVLLCIISLTGCGDKKSNSVVNSDSSSNDSETVEMIQKNDDKKETEQLSKYTLKSKVMKGRYSSFRIVQTLLVAAMMVLMAGSMVSGILLSNHLFKAIREIVLATWARQVHMFCAYWGFAVMSAHLGIHWNIVVNMTGRLFKKPSAARRYIARFVATIAAGYGIYAVHKRQIPEYLLMKNHFVFYDYTESVVFFIADYIAVMILIAFVSYYILQRIINN